MNPKPVGFFECFLFVALELKEHIPKFGEKAPFALPIAVIPPEIIL